MVCMDEDLASINLVVCEVGVATLSLLRWFNKLPIYHYIAMNDHVGFLLSTGCYGELEDIGTELLTFVDYLHKNGFAVSRKMIVMQASRLFGFESTFSSKSYVARAQSVSP